MLELYSILRRQLKCSDEVFGKSNKKSYFQYTSTVAQINFFNTLNAPDPEDLGLCST